MTRKITAIVLLLIMVLFLVSFGWSFESNGNFDKSTSDPTDQRPYTKDNAAKPLDQGGYYGGHDTIVGEAALLKKDVHEGDNLFKDWVDQESLPSFRTGAHDEDSKKYGIFDYLGGDAPIGPNGDGDYFKHFYNPDTGKGLWGNDSAAKRIKIARKLVS